MKETKFDIVPSATGNRFPDPEWGLLLRIESENRDERYEITLEKALLWNERLTDWIHHMVRNGK